MYKVIESTREAHLASGLSATNQQVGGLGFTVQQTWEKQSERKPKGCSWKAWGVICVREINPRFGAIAEMQEEMDYYKDLFEKNKIDFIG